VLSSALRAAAAPTPTPKSGSSAKANATPEPTNPTADPLNGAELPPPADTGTLGQVPPALTSKFLKLDCTKPENRQGGDTSAPTDYIVACDKAGDFKFILAPAALEGTELSGASAGLPSGASTGAWQIDMTFNGKGTKEFADITSTLAKLPDPRNHLAITLDGVVMSDPTVNETIPNGRAQINGSFTQVEAQDLANVLKYGALPLAFTKSKIDTVSATLGADQLNGGLTAGVLGLACVVLYCLFYYRGLGAVALLGLCVAATLSYMSVTLLGSENALSYRLSLAGVAGLIVAIGITADSFVVYFERLRDEIRDGRSPRAAVEYGWVRARRTILTANFVSLLASAVLYFFSVADVKGFAFTLGLATIIDVVVIFLFTKPMVSLLMRRKFFAGGHKWSGVNRESLGIHRPPGATRGRGRPVGPKEA
jgi:preprotein translocase subunit SecD